MAKIVNGADRNRPNRWLCDWTDASGRRRITTHCSKAEAELQYARVVPLSQQRSGPSAYPHDISVETYSSKFLTKVRATSSPRTLELYTMVLQTHIIPAFRCRMTRVQRVMVSSFITGKINGDLVKPLMKSTAKHLLAILRALFASAIEDGVVTHNPCEGVARSLKLTAKPAGIREKVEREAFDPSQLEQFLTAARSDQRHYPLFFTMAHTGCRISEVLGLKWSFVDFKKNQIHFREKISRGRVGVPKSGYGRSVTMTPELHAMLQHRLLLAKEQHLEPNPLVFHSNVGSALDESHVRKALKLILKKAGLPLNFKLKGFRHSLASIMVREMGVSPAFVQSMLGHADISTTIRTYGSGLDDNHAAALRDFGTLISKRPN
jgi:integrase